MTASNPLFDVAGIGNAIVDVLTFTDDAFLARNGLTKGGMTLVDEARAAQLYEQMAQTAECSGGSVANSLAGMASLGARTAFIGKVKDDVLGAAFTHDMRQVGVHFTTPPAKEGPATANCLVCVTPDAQRSMATYIGACSLVSEDDIDESIINRAAIVYIEGYLWDTENAKAAIRKAIELTRRAGGRIAFTLSDVFCVDRHRNEFLALLKRDIDILFANERELQSLYQTGSLEPALAQLRGVCGIAAVTRSELGCVVLTDNDTHVVAAERVSRIVDTTGAGDLFASGFLHGLSRGLDIAECAALGNRCAGYIITQLGARSTLPLKELVA